MDVAGGVCDYCGADEGRCWDDCPTVKMKQQSDEIERLREALKGLLLIADGVPMSGIDAEKLTAVARSALQQKESE